MNWKSVCCAVQGRGHLKKNIPCQDKVARLESNGVQVIALADGAGSASMSHFGAACVVESVSKFVAENFSDIIAQDDGRLVTQKILSVALQALTDEAKIHDCTLKDLASTLLLAAVSDEKFFLAHLGDGVIGYLSDAGLKTASVPDNGEFSNETFFVTSAQAAAHMRIFKGALKKISGFILMSDGSEQSLYNKRKKILAPAVTRLMHRTCLVDAEILTPQLEDAIKSVILDNTQDDCSLAILARTSEQLPPLNELPLSERQEFFRVNGNRTLRSVRKKIFRCDEICLLLARPLTLRQLSRKLHVKPLYVRKKLHRLFDAGIVTRTAFQWSAVSG